MAETTDLERAFNALKTKLVTYNQLYQYADGKQPLVYSTERLKEAFNNLNAYFNQNWCAVVINTTLDRLRMRGFDPADKKVNDKLDNIWARYHLDVDAYDVHRDALITTEGYIIAWRGADGLEIYRNDPRMVHLFYKADRPKIKEFAAKWYLGSDKRTHLVLYYPDRLEYYVSKGKDQPSTVKGFDKEMEDETNLFGVVPVFHFRSEGELANIITLQDAINKLQADMMVAAEYGAYKQRYVITNADTKGLKNGPNMVWEIPAGDGTSQPTQVGEFSAADLTNYIDSMDKIANVIAVISRVPKHYLTNAGSNISGDALVAMEAPLVKKVEQRQERFSITWQELASFLLKLEGTEAKAAELLPVWSSAKSDQPVTDAQNTQYQVQAGIPLETVLRRKGWSNVEILQMRKDAEEEKARNAQLASALLEKLRAEQDAKNE